MLYPELLPSPGGGHMLAVNVYDRPANGPEARTLVGYLVRRELATGMFGLDDMTRSWDLLVPNSNGHGVREEDVYICRYPTVNAALADLAILHYGRWDRNYR